MMIQCAVHNISFALTNQWTSLSMPPVSGFLKSLSRSEAAVLLAMAGASPRHHWQ